MRLEVSCEDRLGLTRELLDRLVEHNIDLRGIEIDTSGIIYLNFPELEFRDFQHLMPEIRRIPGVYDVKTIPYMPSEREHHEIEALLKALPESGVLSRRQGQGDSGQPVCSDNPCPAGGRDTWHGPWFSGQGVLLQPLAGGE